MRRVDQKCTKVYFQELKKRLPEEMAKPLLPTRQFGVFIEEVRVGVRVLRVGVGRFGVSTEQGGGENGCYGCDRIPNPNTMALNHALNLVLNLIGGVR